jgi:signal transduction histidine kinase
MAEEKFSSSAEKISITRWPGTEDIICPFVNRLLRQTKIVLDPSRSETDIFQILTKNIVEFFEAEIASIWLFENYWQHLASFVWQESLLNDYMNALLFDPVISDEIVRSGQPLSIPDIWKEERWQNKEPFRQFRTNSVLVVPIVSPRFQAQETHLGGVLQLFFKEENKSFSLLEIKAAQLFSRQVSYVLARKRITDLQKNSSIKDRIVEHIFRRLAKGEGIFMRDLFNSVIPDLSEIMNIQRCALFSVNLQKKEAVLEAGYPEEAHGIGKTRSVEEPYIQRIIGQKGPFGRFEYERIDPKYILITDPRRSHLIPGDIRYFLETQNIHSVLYLALKRDEEVDYFLTFDAQGHHERFTEEEIEIFLFFGMELMKGLRLERLHDLLHDSKNIGISLTYFARRIEEILRKEEYPQNERLNHAVEIILEASNRLQGLFLGLFGEEKEAVVDLTEVASRRFLFYRETMKEMKRETIHFIEKEMKASLLVRCVPAHIERVTDNLLSNAITAIPDEGGEISIRTWQQGSWAGLEIANTGRISREEIDRYLWGEEGKRKGRGLHICNQLIRNMGGEIDVEVKEGFVICRILLPLKQV